MFCETPHFARLAKQNILPAQREICRKDGGPVAIITGWPGRARQRAFRSISRRDERDRLQRPVRPMDLSGIFTIGRFERPGKVCNYLFSKISQYLACVLLAQGRGSSRCYHRMGDLT
jgi:hypothetical protein